MSNRRARIKIEYIWVLLLTACVVLLGMVSLRRHRQTDVHIAAMEYNASPADVPIRDTPPAAPESDLAARSRARFASLLGLDNYSQPKIELESEKWKPLIIRQCTADMPPYFAPCLARVIPTLEYGEELVYPDFEAALPGFFDRADAESWVSTNYGPAVQGQTGNNKRVIYDERQGRLVYVGLRGQNLVFKNVRYTEATTAASWADDSSHCMGHMYNVEEWRDNGLQPRDSDDTRYVDEAVMYITPDSERYQHWLDHTTKPLMQSAHLITNQTLILPGGTLKYKQPIVETMWGWLPHINVSQISSKLGDVRAQRLITACRVPYVHPYLFLRLQEMILGPEAPRVPLSERKVVMWYSRTSADISRRNRGREIKNEDKVMKAISQLLEVHPPEEETMDPLEYVRYLNRNVAAMIGPHGGGLCNFKWLAANTLVLELMPRDWISSPLYEEAIGHGLNYWVDLLEPLSSHHDMVANVSNIVSVLAEELGQVPRRGPIISYYYDWPVAVEDAVGADPRHAAYFKSLKRRCCHPDKGQPGWEGLYILGEQS